MTQIRERLRRAIEKQGRPAPRRRMSERNVEAEAALQPIREAAAELRDELASVHDLKIEIGPDGVWFGLYDKHLWFGYDPELRAFVGDELNNSWMEGGVREESFKWETADACIEAMIRACARYVSLANAIANLRPGR